MPSHPDLHLLVANDGLDLAPSVRQAVAQLSASCHVDLTVARVDTGVDDAGTPSPLVFDPEASPRRIQRLALDGPDVADAIAAVSRRQRVDLVLAPARRAAWWQLGRPSFRSRLLTRTDVPLWTVGPGVRTMHFARPFRTVACLVDFEVDPQPLLRRAAAFARRMQARLHVLALLPPVDDGTLATVLTSDTPLLPEAAAARIDRCFAGAPRPVVDVVVDGLRRGLRRLTLGSHPDVLFVDARRWHLRWPFRFPRMLDALDCPIVCLPDGAGSGAWSFEHAERTPRAAATSAQPLTITGRPAGPWPAEGMAPRAS